MQNSSLVSTICVISLLSGCSRTEFAPFEVGKDANIIRVPQNGEVVFGPRVASSSYAPIEESPKNNEYEKPITVKEQLIEDDQKDDTALTNVPVKKQSGKTIKPHNTIKDGDLFSNEIKPEPAQATKKATSYTGKTVNNGSVIVKFGDIVDGYKSDGIVIKAPLGTDVHSILNGKVIYAGSQLKEYGNIVVVKHQNDLISTYAHLQKLLVKKGDTVNIGTVLGTVGKSGDVKFPQLYLQLMKNSTPTNPTSYVKL